MLVHSAEASSGYRKTQHNYPEIKRFINSFTETRLMNSKQ